MENQAWSGTEMLVALSLKEPGFLPCSGNHTWAGFRVSGPDQVPFWKKRDQSAMSNATTATSE